MLNKSFMSWRPRLRRNRAGVAQSGAQTPMSEAKTPVKISRTKAAPVATPIETEAAGSHR